jgi:hypothetical protein
VGVVAELCSVLAIEEVRGAYPENESDDRTTRGSATPKRVSPVVIMNEKNRKARKAKSLAAAATVGQAVWALRREWQTLPSHRRNRMDGLVRKAARRPNRLSGEEWRELWMLSNELRVVDILRESRGRASAGGRFRRR